MPSAPRRLAEIDLARARQCSGTSADPDSNSRTGKRRTNQRTADSTGGCADTSATQPRSPVVSPHAAKESRPSTTEIFIKLRFMAASNLFRASVTAVPSA